MQSEHLVCCQFKSVASISTGESAVLSSPENRPKQNTLISTHSSKRSCLSLSLSHLEADAHYVCDFSMSSAESRQVALCTSLHDAPLPLGTLVVRWPAQTGTNDGPNGVGWWWEKWSDAAWAAAGSLIILAHSAPFTVSGGKGSVLHAKKNTAICVFLHLSCLGDMEKIKTIKFKRRLPLLRRYANNWRLKGGKTKTSLSSTSLQFTGSKSTGSSEFKQEVCVCASTCVCVCMHVCICVHVCQPVWVMIKIHACVWDRKSVV